MTHLLRQHTLWSEVLDPIASDFVLQEEQRDGIDVRIEEEIVEIVGRKGQVFAVITTNGYRTDSLLFRFCHEISLDAIEVH